VDTPVRLLDRVQDGSLDLAILYNPSQRPDLIADLVEEKLIMVATASDRVLSPEQYGLRGLGPAFAAKSSGSLSGPKQPSRFDFARPLSAHIYLTVGGCGYFRKGTARPFLTERQSFPIRPTPYTRTGATATSSTAFEERYDAKVASLLACGGKS
jgi:hypothetical protein